MVKKEEIYRRVAELQSYNGKWKGKWLRNYRLYCYSMNVSLDQIREGNTLGYWAMADGSGETTSVNENVIASCIDSLTSMIASKLTRPYLSGINTTFNERQIITQAQQYFDIFIDKVNLNNIITEAFRDACIFGNGFIYIDAKNKNILKALPWQVMYRPSEKTYGKITRVLYERKDYPTTLLPYKLDSQYVTYSIYYDTEAHQEVHLVNNEIKEILPYLPNEIPFIQLNYTNPVYGRDATSIVDLLYGIQMKIHELYKTFSEAARLNPALTYFVPKGSDLKASSLTNRVGQIIQYKPIEGLSNPVQVATPNFIADQYIQAVQMLKNDAYELTGVSKLSAQSQKPSGLDSGKALQTINDIESERFEVQQRAVINAYVDVMRLCILCFDPEENILPDDLTNKPIKWADLQNLIDKTKISMSALSYLSKEPSTRLSQIKEYAANGWINNRQAMTLIGVPDNEAAYTYANCSYNAVQEVINEALQNEDYTIPDYIPIDLLKSELVITLLSLRAVNNEENQIYIPRLEALYKEAVNVSNALLEKQNQSASLSDEQSWQAQLNRQAQEIVNQQVAQAQGQLQAQQLLTTNNSIGEYE